jgi:transposase-like protein
LIIVKKCPACNSKDINYIEIYNNSIIRIVRSGDKKELYFVESSQGDLLSSRYHCDSCKRSFVEQDDDTVKVIERDGYDLKV